jgi:hypothetical protein
VSALQRGDAFSRSSGGGNGSESWNALSHGCTTDGLLVKPWILTLRRVHHKLDAITFDQIDNVRSSFLYFVHTLD